MFAANFSIRQLIKDHDFQTARVFPLLELRGFDGVVNDNVDDNSIWIEYISAICFFWQSKISNL